MKNGLEIYDNILTSEECAEIISLYESNENKRSGEVGRNIVDPTIKKSTDIGLSFISPSSKKYNKILRPALNTAAKKFISTYDILNKISPWRLECSYNIQKYTDDEGYFSLHCEQEIITSYRILAWMIYLNDAECGTEFPYQDLIVKAKEGRCVLWSAGWTHAHKGVTPNRGKKYIATGWYEYIH